LQINDRIGQAYVSLGWCSLSFDKDWKEADRYFSRAIELSPNYPFAYAAKAFWCTTLGQSRESIELLKTARSLEPNAHVNDALIATTYYFARDYANAIKVGKELVEADSNFLLGHSILGLAYVAKGDCTNGGF